MLQSAWNGSRFPASVRPAYTHLAPAQRVVALDAAVDHEAVAKRLQGSGDKTGCEIHSREEPWAHPPWWRVGRRPLDPPRPKGGGRFEILGQRSQVDT